MRLGVNLVGNLGAVQIGNRHPHAALCGDVRRRCLDLLIDAPPFLQHNQTLYRGVGEESVRESHFDVVGGGAVFDKNVKVTCLGPAGVAYAGTCTVVISWSASTVLWRHSTAYQVTAGRTPPSRLAS